MLSVMPGKPEGIQNKLLIGILAPERRGNCIEKPGNCSWVILTEVIEYTVPGIRLQYVMVSRFCLLKKLRRNCRIPRINGNRNKYRYLEKSSFRRKPESITC